MKNNGLECIAESCAHCTMVQWNADNEVKCNVLKNTRKTQKYTKYAQTHENTLENNTVKKRTKHSCVLLCVFGCIGI